MLNQAQKNSYMKDILLRITHTEQIVSYWEQCGDGILTILDLIQGPDFNLQEMNSMDARYSNARDDVRQHWVLNSDEDYQSLFLSRLKVISTNWQVFLRFIAACVHPYAVDTIEKQKEILNILVPILHEYSLDLVVVDYFRGVPVYEAIEKNQKHSLPANVAPNSIPFFKTLDVATEFPCFVLSALAWDDWFRWQTKFELSYYDQARNQHPIGALKIFKTGVNHTASAISDRFTNLDDNFCSLGFDQLYYRNLKGIIGPDSASVLLGLRDAAMYPTIRERFEDDDTFASSLCRDKSSRDVLELAQFIMADLPYDRHFCFSYIFRTKYMPADTSPVVLDFKFDYSNRLRRRIYAIIGKNGTGKSTLMSGMAKDFQKANEQAFLPHRPFYNKIITISLSAFDSFPPAERNDAFNYTYLGLQGNGKPINVLKNNLRTNLNVIKKKYRVHQWISIMEEYVTLDEGCYKYDSNGVAIVSFDVDKIMEIVDSGRLSSGESILLYVVSCLLAEIKPYSLILFDEPEQHLHPNAITGLINMLSNLLDEYESFCILTTHSPMIIKELPSSSIIVFKRVDDMLEQHSVGLETFSESVERISDEIFGERDVQKYSKMKIKEICNLLRDYEAVIDAIRQDELPVSLSMRLFIRECLNEKH
ncbi:MAG: AAA family ATPase [Bacteroidales bacterium]|nr:AAA family ATPase [Candidatus Colicola equi]